MERPSLSLRLQTVYDLATLWRDKVSSGRRLIDVGSDHGYVSLEGLVTGDYDTVVATDIHEHPASKTKELLGVYGYQGQSTVVCTDGLKGVELMPGDTVIMAGLGGNNMMEIMEEAMKVTSKEVLSTVVWCLQPQKTIEELRVFLCEKGFEIKDEKALSERNLFYTMLTCVFDGQVRSIDLYEKYYGPVLVKRYNGGEELIKEYFDKLDEWYKIRARGDEEIRLLTEKLSEFRK
mgnify:CR=1 FL=1